MNQLATVKNLSLATEEADPFSMSQIVWETYESIAWLFDHYSYAYSPDEYIPNFEAFFEDETIENTINCHASYLLYDDSDHYYHLENEDELNLFYEKNDEVSATFYKDIIKILDYHNASYVMPNYHRNGNGLIINNQPIVEVW